MRPLWEVFSSGCGSVRGGNRAAHSLASSELALQGRPGVPGREACLMEVRALPGPAEVVPSLCHAQGSQLSREVPPTVLVPAPCNKHAQAGPVPDWSLQRPHAPPASPPPAAAARWGGAGGLRGPKGSSGRLTQAPVVSGEMRSNKSSVLLGPLAQKHTLPCRAHLTQMHTRAPCPGLQGGAGRAGWPGCHRLRAGVWPGRCPPPLPLTLPQRPQRVRQLLTEAEGLFAAGWAPGAAEAGAGRR